MKIYFAGSIRGGRENREAYLAIISFLQKHGRVLTEHVAHPSISEKGESNERDEFIYRRDIEWLNNSDILVAEVTTPSLGVGYEISKAESSGKPVLCLFKNDATKQLSAMIAGNPNLTVVRYNFLSEVESAVESFIKKQAGVTNFARGVDE